MTPGPCPDPGLIAAHAEGRLVGDEAARLEAHLASCPTCYEVFAETTRFSLDEEAEGANAGARLEVLPFVRRPAFRAAAAVVAAAGVVLAVQTWGRRDRVATVEEVTGTRHTPLVADLAEALGERRVVEPRLTGGFPHARLVVLRSGEAPEGLDAYPPDVLAAVARIRELAGANPKPEALGALGVTYLVSGDVRAAVEALESATEQAPNDPRLQSDLAAAYLVRATRLDEPADLPKALEAAETATALGGAPVEAWFNRALALESLHLVEAARTAWEDYLERDATSGWADEARRHLEELPAERQSSLEEDRARVRAALEEGSKAVERLAEEAPSLLRNHFESDLLPAWAEARLVGHPDALVLRDQARLVGDALLRSTGDALPRDTARALGSPAASPGARDPPRAQALGFRSFREATRLHDRQEPSCASFREAGRLLASGGNPYEASARERSVLACLYPDDPETGLAELEPVEALARERGYRHLLGRVHWRQGLFFWHRGGLTAAVERYRRAHALFRATGDTVRQAFAFVALAESFHMAGEHRHAWRERRRVLALLGHVRDPRCRHSALVETALACLDERLPRAALAFQTAVVEAAVPWSNAVALSDALVRRASIRLALGSSEPAAADLAEARRWIPRIADRSFAGHMAAEADAVEGEMLAEGQPGRATEVLERAITYFASHSPIRTPRLHLLRARAERARGRGARAEEALRAGIELLESQRVSLLDPALQASFFDSSLALFDEMVDLQLDDHRDPDRALLFVERSRARQLADSLASPAADDPGDAEEAGSSLPLPLEPGDLQKALPGDTALVYYSSREDRLLSWALTRDENLFAERALPSRELRRLVASHEASLQQRSDRSRVRELSARLYDELLQPLTPVLASHRALILIPDDVVRSVAFASLWDRRAGRYLVESHLVGLAPSGTVFANALARAAEVRHDPGSVALVVGNPRLDGGPDEHLPSLAGAEAEATEIAALYAGSDLLTGRQATKAAFLRRMPHARIVHFAGHALSDEAPWTARLLLAPDPTGSGSGALYLHELDGRSLPHTRVVVLAACRSAAGAVSRLEGGLVLARPFLAAGVPNVVASLWDVDDTVSRRFFVEFHRALLEGGEPLAALRRTQVRFLRGRDLQLAHPASWAGFVSVGGLGPSTTPSDPLHDGG